MAPISHPRYRDGDGPGQTLLTVLIFVTVSRCCAGWNTGGTRQLHIATKNYTHNYTYTAGIHQNRRITYKRALRNLMVLMFSHFVHQLENSGSLEGHRTLVVHECLQVAAALGQYHRWQCRVNLQETSSENADWNKVPISFQR